MPFSSDLERQTPPNQARFHLQRRIRVNSSRRHQSACEPASSDVLGAPEPDFSKPVLADEVPLHVEDKLTAMRDPDTAAHIVGKLVKHIGEKNVLYGSDCIWYGSPQDQIQAFRTFQISEAFQHKYGYPEMTSELRARIFGLNATRPYGLDVDEVIKRANHDAIERRRAEYRERPDPHFLTFGPKFLANFRARGGSPV